MNLPISQGLVAPLAPMPDLNRMMLDRMWHTAYPQGDPLLVETFENMRALAWRYHQSYGRHLKIFGDLGELYAAIVLGMRLTQNNAKGVDGRRGNDHIEVKTISPMKSELAVQLSTAGPFNHLAVVKIDAGYGFDLRLATRKSLQLSGKKQAKVRWDALPQGGY